MLNENVFFLEDTPHGLKPKVSVVLPPTEVAAKQNLFAEAMLEGSSTRQKRHPLKWAVSLGAHIAVLFILLLMPLYFSQGLNLQRLNMTMLVAPLPLAAAPPPPPPAAAPRVARVIPKTFTPGKLTAPSYVPKAVVAVPDAAPRGSLRRDAGRHIGRDSGRPDRRSSRRRDEWSRGARGARCCGGRTKNARANRRYGEAAPVALGTRAHLSRSSQAIHGPGNRRDRSDYRRARERGSGESNQRTSVAGSSGVESRVSAEI